MLGVIWGWNIACHPGGGGGEWGGGRVIVLFVASCLNAALISFLSFRFQVGPTSVQITTPERHRVLGYSSILNDVYYASEVKGVSYLCYEK